MTRLRNTVVIAAIALLLPTAVTTAGPVAHAPAGGDLRSPGKPGAPVSLLATVRAPERANSGGKPAVSRPLDVEIVVEAPADAELLSLAVSPDDALALVSGGKAQVSAPKGPFRHVVSVVPQAEGRHYLGVTVSLLRGGELRMRSFAVPVTVGSPDTAAVQAKRTDLSRNSDGELIVITYSR